MGPYDVFSLSSTWLRSWSCIVATEVVHDSLNPTWRPARAPLLALCGGNEDQQLLIECWDWNKTSEHELIGSCLTSLRQLRNVKSLPLVNEERVWASEKSFHALIKVLPHSQRARKGHSYVNSGVLQVSSFLVERESGFVDYTAGGCQISLTGERTRLWRWLTLCWPTVAIDFTSSNGEVKKLSSLHHNNPGNLLAVIPNTADVSLPEQPNEYLRAIESIGQVLAPYDSTGKIAVYGFGAKFAAKGDVSHCWALNGNPEHPEVFFLCTCLHPCLRTC
jgi:hypothetical protein